MAAYTNHTIALNDTDEKRLQALRDKGHSVVDILRKGMEATENSKRD